MDSDKEYNPSSDDESYFSLSDDDSDYEEEVEAIGGY